MSFGDGTVREAFLSTKAFLQLVKMKIGTPKKPVAPPVPANGPPAPTKT